MASLSSFLTHYHEELKRELSLLEQKRIRVLYRVITGWVVIFLGAITVFLLLVHVFLPHDHGVALLVSAGLGLASALGYTQYATRTFGALFKEQVIGHMARYFDLAYTAQGAIPKRDFEHARLFLHPIDRYQGDDLVQGEVEGVKVAWSDLHVHYLQKRANGKSTRHTLFQGLFFKAPFPKTFHTRTWVLPDVAQKVLGDFGSLLQRFSSRGKLMKLDNPAFERAFVVYGEDPVEVRYLLTPRFMEQLLALQNQANVPLHVSFCGGNIYLAFSYGKASFEPSLFHPLTRFATLKEHSQRMLLLRDVVKMLGLQER